MQLDAGSGLQPLTARTVENAVVYPTIRVASHPEKLLMGVYDGAGRYVEGTVLDRRSGEQGAPVPPGLFPDVGEASEPEAIYLGPLYYHFGHFLLESLARLWYAARRPDLPLVWAGSHVWQGWELRPWQQEILDLLEISNPTRIAADPTRFAILHVPDLGYRYDDRFHPEHAAFLGRYRGPAQVPGHRLWLSRTKIDSDVRDLNAEPTERRLAHAGWTIMHPETLRVRQQLDLLARAEVVAGEEGSAFHAAMLLADLSGKRFQILRRHGAEHRNLITIGAARSIDQTFHTLAQERVLAAEGRVVTKLNPNPAETLDVLGVPVPPPPTEPPSADDQLLSEVVNRFAPEHLLVVGDPRPTVALGSTAASRVVVSPRLDVDPRTYADRGVEFYELPLERYADVFHQDRPAFDLIRIAGPDLPSMQEVFRVTRRLAAPRTVWLLGCGEAAERLALTVELLHPGFVVRRLLVRRRSVFLAWRAPGRPTGVRAIAALPRAQVAARLRFLPVVRLPRPGGQSGR